MFMSVVVLDDAMARAGIYARFVPLLDRYVQLGMASGRVINVAFPEDTAEDAESEHPLLDRLDRYFDGSRDSFEDVAVALTVPTDHRKVLDTLRQVPYGEGITVEQLARMTPGLDPGDPDDLERTRRGLSANPTPLLIPSHRAGDGRWVSPASVVEALRSLEGL